MESKLRLEILPQPDDSTCGPTCLHAVYRYYGDGIQLDEVIADTPALEGGGTLAVLLGSHALARGYRATIYTYNLQVFDPTWFSSDGVDVREKLLAQADLKPDDKLRTATRAYVKFLDAGGELRFEDLTAALIRRFLNKQIPILTGLSATYLYRSARERGTSFDDVGGTPAGHFVVLCGYHKTERKVLVADPWAANPVSSSHQYWVDIGRLLNAILLGILTYDANLLVIEPGQRKGGERAGSHRRQ